MVLITDLSKLLWQPAYEDVAKANIKRFMELVNAKNGLSLDPFEKGAYFHLYEWSVTDIPAFWDSVWEFVGIRAVEHYDMVVDDLDKFPGAKWFVGARLNFAENLLKAEVDRPALISRREDGYSRSVSYQELRGLVGGLSKGLLEEGIGVNDRVAAYMPNIIETSVAMLAATSLGASWSSIGTEMGVDSVIDRFGQVEPKVLFTVDGYIYRGKEYDVLERVREIARNIPSIKRIVIVPYLRDNPRIDHIPKSILIDNFMSAKSAPSYTHVPASSPLYIMFSSGTTGKPKCMVQPIAGVLVNHLKELVIHTDLKPEDVVTYITSPSWMMWNWLMSALAVGSTIFLYDGDPNYPDWRTMWRLVEELEITVFGCSASYINNLRGLAARPGELHNLESLREISQTGSALSPEGFEWIYTMVKKDLHFNSISGGTDINGCFAAGSPILPVYAGQIQSPALGMKIKCYNEEGEPVLDREGELVCEAPAPSMPIYFLNDEGFERYLDAYFRFYTNKRVWRHGDYVIFHSDTGGITFLGRSDATLKPSGVRIGTAEIYRVLESFPEIVDSLAVGQSWRGDQRIILFVKMAKGFMLTDELIDRIKKALRERASPRHVPAIVIEVPDIPYTFNMKKVEIAVANIVNGRKVTNKASIMNPESLDYFEKILPLLRD
jgi:acetoacetyl-CoA synthetase